MFLLRDEKMAGVHMGEYSCHYLWK